MPNVIRHRASGCRFGKVGLPQFSRRFWGGFLPALVLLILLAAGFLLPVHALTISAVKKDAVVFVRKVNPGDRFSCHAIHSVELSPFGDYFRIDEDFSITEYETTFRSSNVGLPYAAFGREVFIREADGFRITNMNRAIPELYIWANERYGNRLAMGGESWPLHAFRGNTLLRIGVDRLSLFEFIYLSAFSG